MENKNEVVAFIELMQDLSAEEKSQMLYKTAKEWLGI